MHRLETGLHMATRGDLRIIEPVWKQVAWICLVHMPAPGSEMYGTWQIKYARRHVL